MSTRVLLLIVSIAVAVSIASLLAPDLDLELARWFYDPTAHRFWAAADPFFNWLRKWGPASVIVVMAAMVVAIVAKLIFPLRPLLIPGRAIVLITLSLALGPGLLVNGVLKANWGRPRPIEVVQLGGTKQYVAWWDNRGTCTSNCSFISGEAASAAWLLAPAVLLPAPWRAPAVAAVLLFTATMGLLRMAFGGHFFTDVMFGILTTAFLIWLLHGLIYRWARTRLSERALDRATARFSLRLRRAVCRVLGAGPRKKAVARIGSPP